MLYRLLLFSVKHQNESAIGIHMSPPSWTSFLPPSPSHSSRLIRSPCLSSLRHTANSHWLPLVSCMERVVNNFLKKYCLNYVWEESHGIAKINKTLNSFSLNLKITVNTYRDLATYQHWTHFLFNPQVSSVGTTHNEFCIVLIMP